jgi:predicted membrane protein
MTRTSLVPRIAGGAAIVFGLLTVAFGGATLIGELGMRTVVYFVLWFNTAAGLAYIVAGVGLWQARRWAYPLSLAIFAATLLVFAGLGLHVVQGGAYEMRTVVAMALRSAVWGAIALVARQMLSGR